MPRHADVPAAPLSGTSIAGIGQTAFAKNLGRPERRLALEAISAALDEAGLAPAEVDGLVRFDIETTTEVEIARNLGMGNLRFFGEIGYGGGAACATIAHAAMAVATRRASVIAGSCANRRPPNSS